jgi:hypothetical protein
VRIDTAATVNIPTAANVSAAIEPMLFVAPGDSEDLIVTRWFNHE